jgi:hypothetical protein
LFGIADFTVDIGWPGPKKSAAREYITLKPPAWSSYLADVEAAFTPFYS